MEPDLETKTKKRDRESPFLRSFDYREIMGAREGESFAVGLFISSVRPPPRSKTLWSLNHLSVFFCKVIKLAR